MPLEAAHNGVANGIFHEFKLLREKGFPIEL